MSTSTTNYGFTLPAVADPIDEDLWGGELNSNFSSLDDILPTPAANKYGAIAVQNATDNGLDYITSQGTAGQALISNGPDALPSFQSFLSLAYPIGSYYFNETDPTNPATLFGFGTWVSVADKFIVARGSTYTSTGGSPTVTLTEANLAAHYHLMYNSTNVAGGTVVNSSTSPAVSRSGIVDSSYTMVQSVGGAPNVGRSETVGSATPIDIIPPYQAVYVWKRTV